MSHLLVEGVGPRNQWRLGQSVSLRLDSRGNPLVRLGYGELLPVGQLID